MSCSGKAAHNFEYRCPGNVFPVNFIIQKTTSLSSTLTKICIWWLSHVSGIVLSPQFVLSSLTTSFGSSIIVEVRLLFSKDKSTRQKRLVCITYNICTVHKVPSATCPSRPETRQLSSCSRSGRRVVWLFNEYVLQLTANILRSWIQNEAKWM